MHEKLMRTAAGVAGTLAVFPAAAGAQEAVVRQPAPWEVWLQPAATPVAERMHAFNTLLTWIIFGIVALVAVLLLYVAVRFRAKAHPKASRTSHNALIEVLWTVVPVAVLVVIAVPSFRLLYYGDKAPDAQMTVKVIGHQWYWEYQYPDEGDLALESRIVPDGRLQPGDPRLLKTDNALVVPVDTTVRVLVTSQDVIHSWLVPSFGVQKYAMPGRMNETWFRADQVGTFYGQCNQICGFDHGYMPVEVHVLAQEDYKAWIAKAKAQAGLAPAPAGALAALNP